MISFETVPLGELAGSAAAHSDVAFPKLRTSRIEVKQSPLFDDFAVINVFAPHGMIFWSFGMTAAASSAEHALANTLNAHDLRDAIEVQLRRLGQTPKSAFAHHMLGAFSRRFGRHFEDLESRHYWQYEGRHFSVALRVADADSLRSYLESQLTAMGGESLRPCAENVSLVATSRDETAPGYALHARPLARCSDSELTQLAGAAARLLEVDSTPSVYAGITPALRYSGPSGVALLREEPKKTRFDTMLEVVHYRSRVAITMSRLQAIDRFFREMSTPGWTASDAARHIRDKVLARLEEFPWRDDPVLRSSR